MDLKLKIAVITGCKGQLGSFLVQLLVDNGFFVYGLDKEAKEEHCDKFSIFKLDVTDELETGNFFQQLSDKKIKINTLINNAGIAVFTPFEERKKEDFMKVLDVNLFGTFNMIKSSLNFFDVKICAANIVNVSSIYGVISSDPSIYEDLNRMNSEVYSASKAGIIQLTKYFAVHLAKRKILVNCVSPGGIYNNHPEGFKNNYSKKCPVGRMADVAEIADAILFFSKNKNVYLTGQNLIVDGGLTSW